MNHRRIAILASAFAIALLATAITSTTFAAARVAPDKWYPPAGIGRWDPRVTQENIQTTICDPGYTATVRNVPESMKLQVYKRDGKMPDGLPAAQSHCCEIDHYFPLEISGLNDISNLWAESWDKPYGARVKDHTAEDKLQALVCRGNPPMSLKDAQSCLETDWIACAARIKNMKVFPPKKKIATATLLK